jgi:carbamate kinase
VEACIQFMAAGGKRAVITSLENIVQAVRDMDVGTQFVRDRQD